MAAVAMAADGNGGGGGFTVPQPRTQNGNGVVLGVVTEASSGDGARIVAVVPSSPAADGGLQRGDVITKVGDDDVKNPAQLATLDPFAPERRPRDRDVHA